MSHDDEVEYRPPTASLETLRVRAELLARCRSFFAERSVLEVETPLLTEGVVVEAHIDPLTCAWRPEGGATRSERVRPYYLQPSPEAPMKRLLVEGSGPIYQITRAFRDGECGRLHRPEFTLLEWYRPGFDHYDLMGEVGDLVLRELLRFDGWEHKTYREIFEETVGIDPLNVPVVELPRICDREGIPAPFRLDEASRNGWLDLILTQRIEPELGRDRPVFVYDYPPSQAALAQIGGTEQPVAERFELYVHGVELCNGYHELLDAREHRLRFEEANVRRAGRGRGKLPPDTGFLAALEKGLPACSGVAVGFDRVVMLAAGLESVEEAMTFAFTPPEEEDAKG